MSFLVSEVVNLSLSNKGERFFYKFERNQFQVVNTNIFFNFKKHLQKTFFANIKFDHHKWLFVIKKMLVKVFFLLLKICRYWHQKNRHSKKSFYQIMKNSQVEAEN